MFLVYLDDSSDNSDFQIMAAFIMPEQESRAIEGYLGHLIDEHVPEELRDKFEFHASKLFHSKDEFAKFGRDKVLQIFKNCITIFKPTKAKMVYGAVDIKALRRSHYATAQPSDIAFRLCMEGLEAWFREQNLPDEQIGILICDDTEKQHIKKNIQQAYRAFRGRFRRWGTGPNPGIGPHPVTCFHDDIYFADSAYSVGIQLADIFAFIVLRHLEGMEDTEFLYEELEPHIYSAKIEPNGRIPEVRRSNAAIDADTAQRDQRSLGSGKADKEEAEG